jgi:hypothetical protein
MGPYPRHVRPAPKGPDPIHWWTSRLIGLAIMGVVSALYFGGWLGAFPVPTRQFLAGAFFLLGFVVFLLSWFIPWLLEG